MLLSDLNIKPTANSERKDSDLACITAMKAKMNRVTQLIKAEFCSPDGLDML